MQSAKIAQVLIPKFYVINAKAQNAQSYNSEATVQTCHFSSLQIMLFTHINSLQCSPYCFF